MARRVWHCSGAALGIGVLAAASAAAAPVILSVRYPAQGAGLTISSEPELHFRCTSTRRTIVCVARVSRGTALALRARTRPPAGSSSVSAMSFPIDGKAWAGACAGTLADVCRVRATRALTVRINTGDR